MKKRKAPSEKPKTNEIGRIVPIPRPQPRVGHSPGEILREIGETFNRLREDSAILAYSYARKALSANAHILVPAVISLDHFWGLIMQMEEYSKGTQKGNETHSPAEALAEWLNEEDRLQ